MPKERGFTLIELLVVIAIIGMLSSVVLSELNRARSKAKIAKEFAQIHQLKIAAMSYSADTGNFVPFCDLDCTALTDPFLNALSVPGWGGPYFPNGTYALNDAWGGHLTIGFSDITSDSVPENYILLDDDAAGTNYSDDTGVIPTSSLLEIDQKFDDGNLSTGNARGDGNGYGTVVGEMRIIYNP